jgi:uncharacterized protein YnzC (UPF0291/DUF896 family)
MKNIFSVTIALVVGFSLFGCSELGKPSASSQSVYKNVMKIDVRTACNVQKNGVEKVLALAEEYNPTAVKDGVEFKRLGMTTSQYIDATKKALKDGSKTIDIVDKEGKKVGEESVAFGAWRSCAFAVSALKQKVEAKSTWRLAVPGDGFKY